MNFRLVRYVQYLDISYNNIVSLDKTSLSDLGVISLVQLNASRNYISYIDDEAFLGQSKLRTVDLSSNNLKNIEPKTFIRNPSLEVLSLSSNRYLTLPEEGTLLYSTSLRVLQISACNLSHIPPKTFQELPNLQELYISHNSIRFLYNVQGFGHLATLDISHNYLRDLDSDIFIVSPKLIHLNLSFNNFSIVNSTVIPQLAKENSSVDLNNNPWACDCLMFKTLYSWCRNNSVDLELVCSSPPKFKGQSWKIFEYVGCDVDFATRVETTANVLVSNTSPERAAKYQSFSVPHFPLVRDEVPPVTTNVHYFHISIALIVVFSVLLAVAAILCLYGVHSRKFRRSGPVHSVAETHRLSISTT
jgi:hypothetical protein